MSYKLLITSLFLIVFTYGSVMGSVTFNPDLATVEGLPDQSQFDDKQKLCFNQFWDIKISFEGEERKRWNCPQDKCEKGHECCAAYEVYDRTKAVTDFPKDCGAAGKGMIKSALPKALKMIQQKCEPEFKHKSEKCRELESKLKSDSSNGGSAPNGKPPSTGQNHGQPKPGPRPAEEPKNGNAHSTTPRSSGIRPDAAFGLAFGLLSVLISQFI